MKKTILYFTLGMLGLAEFCLPAVFMGNNYGLLSNIIMGIIALFGFMIGCVFLGKMTNWGE